MSIFTERTSKKIDTVFVLALITLFAATSLTLVLIGAGQYRFVTDAMNDNYEDRTTASYLAEKIRQNDTENAITLSYLEGVPALSIQTTEDTVDYTTYIYYYEGALRELVITGTSVFSLASGQEIIEMQGFSPEFINDALLRAEITDTNGQKQILYFTLHCNTGKEVL